MKKIIEKFNDYRYRKRLLKFVTVNIKLMTRRFIRVLKSERLHNALKSTPAVMTYISILLVGMLFTATALFTKYVCPYFSTDERIHRRLTMTEYDSNVPYLRALHSLGSSNRIQITLKTETENYINPKGVGLNRGGINLILTFLDGNTVEVALNNQNYDNFESGMTDTFTVILPFGYTPFDITDYTVAILPDIKNKYDSWTCKWARAYFLLGNETTLLAKESWEDTAVFGDGETQIKSSSLEIVHTDNTRYQRTKELYNHYLALASAGMADFKNDDLRTDALYSLSLSGGKYLWLDVETADIEIQNNILTYFTKGIDIPETDSLDYDGLMYLDVTFYTAKEDGTYTESYLLDTLGTDDFELGSSSTFQLEMPKGLCVFDICKMSIRTDNPYDSWAPRYVRAYIKPDYTDILEIARLNDVMITNSYSTCVFYKNLIETAVDFDLTSQFAVSKVVKREFEKEHNFTLGGNIDKMYFDLMSFYDRQIMFFDKMAELYSATVYLPEAEAPETPVPEPLPDDDTAAPIIDETPTDKPPTDAPTDAPTDTPTDTPVDVPTDTPTDAPTETPVEPPVDIPVDTPIDTPTETPTDTPVETPADTPTDTPVETPTDTPVDTPTENPTDTPTETPDETPPETPVEPPIQTDPEPEEVPLV